MTFLLDTNVCIRYLNGRSQSIRQQMLHQDVDDIRLCAIVKAELLFGAVKSNNVHVRLNRLEPFLSRFVSLPFDDRAAVEYARIRTDLERQGNPIGPNDLLIAAIAAANQTVLVTHNIREFGRVNGLQLEDWE